MAIAEGGGDVLCRLVELLLIHLLLSVVFCVALSLLSQVFPILLLQLGLRLAKHHLQEAEGRGQVLQVLFDHLEFVYVVADVVVPLVQ